MKTVSYWPDVCAASSASRDCDGFHHLESI
jgi:hypothetical protein